MPSIRKLTDLLNSFSAFVTLVRMLRQDYNYELPEELIAQYPLAKRDDSRLLLLDGMDGNYSDKLFSDLISLVNPGDLLVFNDTRVIPARLFGRKSTGGRVEILVARLLDEASFLAQVRASKTPKDGSLIILDGGVELQVGGRQDDLFELKLTDGKALMEVLEQWGHTPLPRYIRRRDEGLDAARYQTVYANRPGAIAAPTAGLHFTHTLLGELARKGVLCAYVTLHVGTGTFQPIRAELIENHRMHSEWYQVNKKVCEQVSAVKQAGNRVIAVGTTSVRCLEATTVNGRLQPFQGETDIFIYPGFKFCTVDAMITNLHLPGSTLLLLVCAFAGRENILRAYRHAVAAGYRFFSYGDAMFITRHSSLTG